MKFAVNNVFNDKRLEAYAKAIISEVCMNGNTLTSQDELVNFVLNFTDIDEPLTYHRKAHEEFLITFTLIEKETDDMRSTCYKLLVKTLSNLAFCIKPATNPAHSRVYYVTPEVGFVEYQFDPAVIYRSLYPIVSAHFVIRNEITVDLPHSALLTDIPEVELLKQHGKQLDRLGLLPVPFPLEEVLTPDLVKEVYYLYEVKGLSYGNLSTRCHYEEAPEGSYWMTARGVDKSNLQRIGQDVLLVTGYNTDTGRMRISVPPDHDPRVRVSVDAIEHYLIYKEFPEVGAIVHVHAWIDDVHCTRQNYPCGTMELAKEVLWLLRQTEAPAHAEVGLKNHGLTITGESLGEIFERMQGRLHVNVPMFA